ncbi:transcriptional regulator [Nocardioides aromaticivorans]|uniref:Transcriptional regulator n=1 Tax=Nocardioides aromaticivorans TaxID=200618 RepID=A0ABX7PLT7_9ACTN|nr:type IV toxin-antitoxin system AbiEi family antitoxin domain-containing protein [Nocardioides aromaticivorans]QSR26870.1 transcriptional regulator [Nocardioides aromaticivorans]
MKSKEALRLLAEVTAYQWGMVTSAQASMHGITRLDLSRLAADGQLERLAHGVYKDAGAPAGPHDDLQAAWLSTDPKTMGEVRIKDRANGVVVAGESAADLHGIGDFRAMQYDFVSPVRRQTQRSGIRYRQRTLDPRDVTLVDGLPVMTMERTIADLVDDRQDLSLVADALRDASGKRMLDLPRLRELLAPLAARDGFRRGDGGALLDRLMEIAGIDIDTLAHRVAADTSLGALVAADFVGGLGKDDLNRILMTPKMEEAMLAIRAGLAETLERALRPQLEQINAASKQMFASMAKPILDDVAKQMSELVVSGDVMKELTKGWSQALNESIAIKPETLALARTAQRRADSA